MTSSTATTAWADQELRIARAAVDAQLFDRALATLQHVVSKDGAGEAAVDAHFLMASIHQRRGRMDDAMGTYLEIANRFKDHPRAPEALFSLAQSTLASRRSGKETDARRLFGEIASRYPQSSWAPRALMARAELEEKQKIYQRDEELGTSVPSALVTYRQVITQYGGSAATEAALWKLGRVYADIKRHELAAQTFTSLATRFPTTEYDAWFAAAEQYDKRLHDAARAQAAYAQVPPSSPEFKTAQKRLNR